MNRSVLLHLVVYVSLSVAAVGLILNGVAVEAAWARYLSFVPAVVGALVLFFDLWAWRWLPTWISRRPILAGTWRAQVVPASGAPVEGFMVVRQTFSQVSLRLLTEKSASASLTASIRRDPDGVFEVASIYRNRPRLLEQQQSRPHLGGLWLHVGDTAGDRVEGSYWTDRDSKGEVVLHERRAGAAPSNYAEAMRLHRRARRRDKEPAPRASAPAASRGR